MRTYTRFLISTLICLGFSIILGYQYQGTFEYGLGIVLWFVLTVLVVYTVIFRVSQVDTTQILNIRIKTSIEDMLFKLLKNITIFYLLSMLFLIVSYWYQNIDVFGYTFRYDYFTISFIIYSMSYIGFNCAKLTKFNTDLENKIKEEQLNNI